MLAEPPYNARRKGADAHTVHDSVIEADMLALVTVSCDVTHGRAHSQKFCSTLHFALWYDLLQSEVVRGDEIGIDSVVVSTSEVETVSLLYARVVGKYTLMPCVLKAGYTNVVEEAVHFWNAENTHQDAGRSLNFRRQGKVPMTHS